MDGFAALAVIFATSLMVGFSGALMPGPLLTVDISESAKRGFRAGPLLVAGHGIVEAILVLGLTIGLGEVFQTKVVAGTVGILGGAFLLWMGYGIVKAAWRGEVSLKQTGPEERPSNRPVLSGALVSVSNPYWVLWWATLGAAYVVWAMEWGAAGLASFFGGHITSDLVWYSAVALVVSKGRSLLSDSTYRAILLACGVFLWFLSVGFLYAGVSTLLASPA